MKILHLCLSNFYVDNFNYQENILPMINKKHGHEVKIIASTEIFSNGQLQYTEPRSYLNEFKIEVTRLPYRKFLPHFIMKKLRFYPYVIKYIKKFDPDIIFFHGSSSGELISVANFVKSKKNVKLFIDCHSSLINSGRNWFSLHILHGIYYKMILKYAIKISKRVLCIERGAISFLNIVYKIPKEKLEYFPLGGLIPTNEFYNSVRKKIREELKLNDDDIMFLHTGKLDKQKRTCELIQAFENTSNSKMHLFIIGVLLEDIKDKVETLIEKDKRVVFLGWKQAKEIDEFLCAADMYLQPGTPSVTLQSAMCRSCAVMLNRLECYDSFINGNGYYVENEDDMIETFRDIEKAGRKKLELMQVNSLAFAKENLDYENLAKRIYE